MTNPQETAAQEKHLAAATDREAPHSPPDGKPHPSGEGTNPSAFHRLLQTSGSFYQTVSSYLARLAADGGVPSSEIDSVVEETWLEAAQHRQLFTGDKTEGPLVCWLTKVVHSKAVEVLRRLANHPCESLDARAEELIDDAELKRTKATELREWLDVLLAKIRPDHEENVRLLRMHYFQGFSIQELAQMYGKTPDAVDSRIRRVLKQIRALVEQNPRSIGEPPLGPGLRIRGKKF